MRTSEAALWWEGGERNPSKQAASVPLQKCMSQTLELENFRFVCATTDPGDWVEDAGLRLRSALQSLTSLTELRLRDVRCSNLFPSQSMSNLTNLK